MKTIDRKSQTIEFQYDELSRRTRLTRPDNTETQYQYSPRSELLSLNQITYTYDEVGNRNTRTDPGGLHTYFYDPLNQLTQVQGPNPENYQYDSVGNRLSSHLSSSHTTNSLNQLTEDNTFLYRYDLNGNLIQKEEKSSGNITTYTYDSENQLVEMGPSPISYRYDALGRRTEKNVAGQITRYVYDQEDILLQYDETNTLTHSFTHGPGIDEPLALRDNVLNQSFFYHADGLGSITSLTDSAANTIESYTYDSYGNPEIKDSTNLIIPQSLIGNPYLFTGREYDSESKLHYLRARYYDSRIGGFLSEDPVGLAAGVNLYRYVYNNPLGLLDPYGLDAEEILVVTKDGVPHTVLAIDDPLSPSGKRYFDFFPAKGFSRARLAVGLSTRGIVRESTALDPSNRTVIGVTRRKDQSRAEDLQMIQEVRDAKDHPQKYNFYKYNCIGFTSEFIE